MLMLYVDGYALKRLLWLMMRFSWDTRDAAKPAAQLQAHDREILAVAFAPNVDFPHLILTGSADKVCTELAINHIAVAEQCYRPSNYATGVSLTSPFTSSKRTQTRSSTSHGHHTTRPCLPPRQVIVGSTSGISHRLASSKLRMTKRMALLNSSSCTEVSSTQFLRKHCLRIWYRSYCPPDRLLLGTW